MKLRYFSVVAVVLIVCAAGFAQQPGSSAPAQQQDSATGCMAGMTMPGCPETAQAGTSNLMTMQPSFFLEKIAGHTGSGTSVEPISTPASMWMSMRGKWMLMFQGNAFL